MRVDGHILAGSLIAVLAVCRLTAQTPVLGSIEAPYSALQNSVHIAGVQYGPGAVAYGAAGTPLVISGSNFGATGTVQFTGWTTISGVLTQGTTLQGAPTMWTSNLIFVPIPASAKSGTVTIEVEGVVSNALPIIITPGTYAGTCAAAPPSTQLQVTTASLSDAAVGQPYSVVLGATGGTQSYSWSITSGTLPSGLSLNSTTGIISGTPTVSTSSPVDLTVQATDSSSPQQTNDAVLSLTVEPQTLTAKAIYSFTVNSYDGVGNLTNYGDATASGAIMGSWNFQYDTLNRLATGSATAGDFAGQYACWSYDSFGNREQQEFSNESFQSGSGGAGTCQPQTSATVVSPVITSYNANNQILTTNARGVTAVLSTSSSKPGYDAAGNVIWDGLNTYLYDAEGRICAVEAPSILGGTPMFGYIYDADGARIAKGTITSMTSCDPTVNGFQLTESYVLGLGGEELSMMDGNNNWQRTNVYSAGKLLATYDLVTCTGSEGAGVNCTPGTQIPALHFHLEDPLGTRRMQVSGNLATLGVPETDIQSLPFGDQLNSYPDPYAPPSADDSTPLHFTGKELDAESGNDYFDARYYASNIGRFLSPDDGTDQDTANPQSMNRYSYVHNNPLRFTDPFGHSTQTANNGDVLAVYNDGDLGVYQHTDIDNLADWDGSKLDSDDEGTNYMGETERWGEFAQVDKAHPDGIDGSHGKNATIMFGKSLDFQMKGWEELAKMMGKNWTANESRNGGLLDIKSGEYGGAGKHLTGYLVDGKYMTIESAGNFLAGYNAVSTGSISPEFAQKIFGAYQQGGFSAAVWTRMTGKEYKGTQTPYWGEVPYSGFMQVEGENAAKH